MARVGGIGLVAAARLYMRCLGAHVRAVMEYQSDFWLLIGAGLVTQSLGLVFLGSVVARVPDLNGWRFEDMVVVYGLAGLAQGAVPLFSDGIWSLGRYIHIGELDYRLVRPYPAILQVMSSQVGFAGVGDVVGGGALTIWALTRVQVHWTAWHAFVGVLLLLSAAATRIAITVASNTISFWVRSPIPTFAGALFQVGELARYPISIYAVPLRAVIACIVPFAFAGFFPAAWFLGRGGYTWIGLLTPMVATLTALLAYGLFQLGLRRYDSAGH